MDGGCVTVLEKQSRRVIAYRVWKKVKKLVYDCFVMHGNNKYKEAPQI